MQPHDWESQRDVLVGPEALLTAQATWESSPQQLTPDELVQACRAAVRQEDWWSALLWADRGLASVGLTPCHEGKLRFWAGIALIYVGDLYRAERELQRSFQLAGEERALADFVGRAAYNLGHVYRTLDQQRDELHWFTVALNWYRHAGEEDRVTVTLVDIAWSYLVYGSPDAAEPFLREALARAGNGRNPLPAEVHLSWALFYSLKGALDSSEQALMRVEQIWQLQARYRAEVAWMRGANFLAQGDYDSAHVQLALADEAAQEEWWPEQMARIDQLRARLQQRGAM